MKGSFQVKAFDYSLEKSILGLDFITPEEVTSAHPRLVYYTAKQIATLAQSRPSEKVLKWCKDNGYAVMPAPPTAMSMLDVMVLNRTYFYSRRGRGCTGDKFAHEEKTSFGWLIIKKTPVEGSIRKTWSKQNRLISGLERVPNATEMCWFITTYFKVRGTRLFGKTLVRTSSVDSIGRRVYIGIFDSDGLRVDRYWGNDCTPKLGLAVARNECPQSLRPP